MKWVAPILDVILFILLTRHDVPLAQAHLASFGVPFAINCALALARLGCDARRCVHLLAVGLFAMAFHGALIGLLANVWGWSAPAAIVVTAAVTACLAQPACNFALRTHTWSLGSGAQWRALAAGLVGCAFLLRLLYITQIELLPEDSYYWNYAQHLALGYLDHPPMVAWVIWLGTAVFGNTEFGVRIGALCCAAVASLFAYRLTRNLFGEASALVALVLMQVLPFFFLTGMLMTPDAPMTAAWAAALYFLERALLAGQARAWLWAGLSLGLGMISKYTIGMLVPAVLLFVILDRRSRYWLVRWQPYAALAIAGVIFSPVIIWNAQHEWASFVFQTSRRLAERHRFSLHRLILSVLVLLTPTGLATLLASRFSRWRDSDPTAAAPPTDPTAADLTAADPTAADLTAADLTAADTSESAADARRWLFVRLAALTPLAVFVAFSLQHDVKIDWTGALWLVAVPALGTSVVRFASATLGGLRGWVASAWGPTAVIMLLLYAVGLHYLSLGLPGVAYSEHLELVPVGWRDLGQQVGSIAAQVRARTGRDPAIIGMDRYEIASQLSFYMPEDFRARITSRNFFGAQGLMYGRWGLSHAGAHRPLILVAWDPNDLADEVTRSRAVLEPPRERALTRNGIVIRKFLYRVGWERE